MYSYDWDPETGGLLLNSNPLAFSKEPRPVYYEEMDILGFDRYWNYAKDDSGPYMWAEANNYFYRGRPVARAKGGSLCTPPEIEVLCDPKSDGEALEPVDIGRMCQKNADIMEKLAADTIKKIYNTYKKYKDSVDVFYVAFSGGKDSVVALDLVQRALPHSDVKVLFGDTGMEFPDTYDVVDEVKTMCESMGIEFLRASSSMPVEKSWNLFGPPSVSNRWCCSVRKTSPQIRLLRERMEGRQVTGMAFTGIRRDESVSRSEYDDLNLGKKHSAQYSFHPILEWNSAELFVYIYQNGLTLNRTYKKGISRAGCLVCPMSSGKQEYLKEHCYSGERKFFIQNIKDTSGKTNFSDQQMDDFIEKGGWRSRRSGRELNFGYDKHVVETLENATRITVLTENPTWTEWAKTIGKLIRIDEKTYSIDYNGRPYRIVHSDEEGDRSTFTLDACGATKDEVKFVSLFRGIIVKSIYCVHCGVCSANCPFGCINMDGDALSISDDCCHCHACHDIYESCLRYNSIRNKAGETRMIKGIDRYFSFGIRQSWMKSYFNDKGGTVFWNTDGHGEVANKRKDAFLNFLKDADMVEADKTVTGDKYVKYVPTDFAEVLFDMGCDSDSAWALMLCNLAYTPEFNWFIKNVERDETITMDRFRYMLEDVMENDSKGLGKRNISDAFKNFLINTPLGNPLGLGVAKYEVKTNSSGMGTISMESFVRRRWENPDPRVILYSLFKFAEACDGYYQFSLTRLLDYTVSSEGVSPTEIFGIERDRMEKILYGLSSNYPEFINSSFTLDLDNITLNGERTSADVLGLFRR